MKHATWFTSVASLSLLSSCADLGKPPGESADYKRGVAAGRAEIVRQQYWEPPSLPAVDEPALERTYTPIEVPEQVLPDGVRIEAHTEYVETVR